VLALVAGVVIGGAAVAVAFAVSGPEKGTPVPATSTTDEEEMPEPDAEVAEQTLRYLEGEAASVLVMHRTALDLGANPTPEQCRATTTTLDRDAPSDEVQAAITNIPDETLRAVMDGERASLDSTLVRCAGGEVTGKVVPLNEMTALVQRRLDQLEAAR
jgi:hypothetical protein